MSSNHTYEHNSSIYPFCYSHNLFSDLELKKLTSQCEILEGSKGMLTDGSVNENIRKSTIRWVNTESNTEWFTSRVLNEIGYLNKKYYNFNINDFEVIQYADYKSETLDYFDWHIDTRFGEIDTLAVRKVSATLLLNNDFDGGKFQINVGNGKDGLIEPELKQGTLIIFPSYLLHRVTPVTQGNRKSLVVWCTGPSFV